MSEVLVRVDGVRKKFCRSLKKSLWYGMKDVASEALPFWRNTSRPGGSYAELSLRPDEFWAVDDVSFELRRGECLGLIGRNGAGKTTLLKMLNGLIKPDEGRIEMRGRVGALIALGAGFNPILSGRENIYVNGSVLGLSQAEIDSKVDDIIEFADIKDFVDAPVQSYSSGMQVRLGFAVATALKPDILILDEVLAVGDAAFRNRCYARIGELQKTATVIFVTHSMEQVARVCSTGLIMNKGKPSGLLSVQAAVERYDALNDQGISGEKPFCSLLEPVSAAEFELESSAVAHGGEIVVFVRFLLTSHLSAPFARLFFFAPDGTLAGEWNSDTLETPLQLAQGSSELKIVLPAVGLSAAKYRVSFIVHERNNIRQPIWFHKYRELTITGLKSGASHYLLPGGRVHHRAVN